jgi:hypothetical protein
MNRVELLFALGSLSVAGLCAAESTTAPESLDIAGVKLGMTADEVRAVLKARKSRVQEYLATLTYVDSTTQLPRRIPDSMFVNVMVQTIRPARDEPTETLTVFFSPIPGHEQVVAVTRRNQYPRDGEVREVDVQRSLANQFGELPTEAPPVQEGPQFLHVWNVPAQKNESGARCRFNAARHAAAIDPKDPNAALPRNYVLGNQDLILDLVKNDCGPNIIEVNWNTREPHLPPEQRVLDEHTVSIVSLQLADESIVTATETIVEMSKRQQEKAVQSASTKRRLQWR